MAFVTGAIGSLLPKLAELVKEEYQLQASVRKKVESLSLELKSMHTVLQKVGEVPRDQVDEQVRHWASEVREASYDMEDIVDSFLVRVDGRHEPADPNKLKRLWKKIGVFKKIKARHKIAGAIQDINDKLDEVSKRRGRYKLDDIASKFVAPTTVDPRLLSLYKTVTELVGIEGPREKIIEKLSLGDNNINMSNNKMKIISVVGIGGLGKTTAAKAVYEKLRPKFDCGGFVPVGRNPDVKKVLRDILIDLDRGRSEMMMLDERQLIDKLRYFLEQQSRSRGCTSGRRASPT